MIFYLLLVRKLGVTKPLLRRVISQRMQKSQLLSLPNSKVLDWFKLKAFANEKLNVNEKFKLLLERVENNVRTGEHASY